MSIGGHHSASAGKVEWLTPPEILRALGPFDLDPCAPIDLRRPWSTAARHYTEADDGLRQAWDGRVFLNPPYTTAEMPRWLGKLADHNHGTALTFARTETAWFFRCIWERATALLFMETPRLHFYEVVAKPHVGDAWSYFGLRAAANCGGPTVLAAYGIKDADRLADSGLAGAFVPLTGSGQVVAVFRPTDDLSWGQLVKEIASREGGKLTVGAAYVLLAKHPKAAANQNWKAKVRQVLQRANLFERVAPETYAMKEATA